VRSSRRPALRSRTQRDAASLGPRTERTDRIVSRVRAIPPGFVRTYGDIDPRAPRLVGRVLATIHDDLPWHRVVRSDGSVARGRRQLALLRAEGIPIRGNRVNLRFARLPSDFRQV
jgi:methylated-DNA-protein-cysteine methyltransferase related protein